MCVRTISVLLSFSLGSHWEYRVILVKQRYTVHQAARPGSEVTASLQDCHGPHAESRLLSRKGVCLCYHLSWYRTMIPCTYLCSIMSDFHISCHISCHNLEYSLILTMSDNPFSICSESEQISYHHSPCVCSCSVTSRTASKNRLEEWWWVKSRISSCLIVSVKAWIDKRCTLPNYSMPMPFWRPELPSRWNSSFLWILPQSHRLAYSYPDHRAKCYFIFLPSFRRWLNPVLPFSHLKGPCEVPIFVLIGASYPRLLPCSARISWSGLRKVLLPDSEAPPPRHTDPSITLSYHIAIMALRPRPAYRDITNTTYKFIVSISVSQWWPAILLALGSWAAGSGQLGCWLWAAGLFNHTPELFLVSILSNSLSPPMFEFWRTDVGDRSLWWAIRRFLSSPIDSIAKLWFDKPLFNGSLWIRCGANVHKLLANFRPCIPIECIVKISCSTILKGFQT